MKEVLETIDESGLDDVTWDPAGQWHPVHGLTTSALDGYKLGSLGSTTDPRKYLVGVFVTRKKKLVQPAIVSSSWDEIPTGAEVISGLTSAVDVRVLIP